MKGTLVQFSAEGAYDDLVDDLRRRLKESGIDAVVRPKRGRRVLIQGVSPRDIGTFMYLACFNFEILSTDVGT